MSATVDPTLLVPTGQTQWTPKHATFTQPLQQVYDLWNPAAGDPLDRYNATTRVLLRLVADAVRDDVPLRALGGGWSFSRAPATTGRLVNTAPMNLYFRLGDSSVHPAYGGDRDGLRFAQCGCSIQELNRHLRAENRSLRTHGASNGQTIAGALSTGTHGSAIDVGSIPDYVVGLHLVVSADRHVWLERASAPAASDTFAARLGAEVVRDDALFDAALVSFGAFGFIAGVMFETDPLFLLTAYRRRAPLADLRAAMTALDFTAAGLPRGAERPYHFQLVVNPYDLEGAFVTTMYRDPFHAGYTPPSGAFDKVGPGEDGLFFVGLATDAVPSTIPTAVNRVLAGNYPLMEGVQGTIGEIFSNTTTRGRAASTALALPLDRAGEALDLALAINRRHGPYAVLPALRYVRCGRATLGWIRYAPFTCILELDGPLTDRTMGLYRMYWRALVDAGIPHAFHWGKQFETDAAGIRRAYGPAVDTWLAARRTLLPPEVRRVFTNDYMAGLGLAD